MMQVGPTWTSASSVLSSQLSVTGWMEPWEGNPRPELMLTLLSPSTGRVHLGASGLREVEIELVEGPSPGDEVTSLVTRFQNDDSQVGMLFDYSQPELPRVDEYFEWRRVVLLFYTPEESELFREADFFLPGETSELGVLTGKNGYVELWNIHGEDGTSCIPPTQIVDVLHWWQVMLNGVATNGFPIPGNPGLIVEEWLSEWGEVRPLPPELDEIPDFSWESRFTPRARVPLIG